MGRNARSGADVPRRGLLMEKTVPIGNADRKSRAVTAVSRAEALGAGTVQSAAIAHQTAWRLSDRREPAGGGNGQDGLPVLTGSARVAG
jgi:hypothetical protein